MDRPIFYRDECVGEYEGDILAALAPLLPIAMADRVRRLPPVVCRWKVTERITWEGYYGHRFSIDPATSDALKAICDELFEDRHKTPGYPGFYADEAGSEGLPKVCIIPDCFVIWQPGTVSIPNSDPPQS